MQRCTVKVGSSLVSWERTLAAILAGVAVTRMVPSRRSWLWALIVAALYALDYRVRSHWAVPPTTWDRLSMRVDHFFPAVACLVAALITAWLRRKRELATVPWDGWYFFCLSVASWTRTQEQAYFKLRRPISFPKIALL